MSAQEAASAAEKAAEEAAAAAAKAAEYATTLAAEARAAQQEAAAAMRELAAMRTDPPPLTLPLDRPAAYLPTKQSVMPAPTATISAASEGNLFRTILAAPSGYASQPQVVQQPGFSPLQRAPGPQPLMLAPPATIMAPQGSNMWPNSGYPNQIQVQQPARAPERQQREQQQQHQREEQERQQREREQHERQQREGVMINSLHAVQRQQEAAQQMYTQRQREEQERQQRQREEHERQQHEV